VQEPFPPRRLRLLRVSREDCATCIALMADKWNISKKYWWNDTDGKIQACGVKPVRVPLCVPQIPHRLAWYGTKSSAVKGRRLRAWDTARLQPMHMVIQFHNCKVIEAMPSGCAVSGVGLRPPDCWDCRFESRRGHGCLSLVSVVLPGRGLCVQLITRPEKTYRVRCAWVWTWSLDNEDLSH
jgi:hypothetical protein